MPTLDPEIWVTREGDAIRIKNMASSHLLSTIHYIEKHRFMSAVEIFHDQQDKSGDWSDALNYYLQWPPQYETMIVEAQRRNLIFRNVQGLVKSRKK